MRADIRVLKILVLLPLIIVLTGCVGYIYFEKIDDKYAIIAVDTLSDASVCRKVNNLYEGRINSNVKEVGVFKSIIFVKKDENQYYILDKKNDSDTASSADCVSGPYTMSSLLAQLQRIGYGEKLSFNWKVQ